MLCAHIETHWLSGTDYTVMLASMLVGQGSSTHAIG